MVFYLSVPHMHAHMHTHTHMLAHLHATLLPLLNQNGILPVSSTHTCTPAHNLVASVESELVFNKSVSHMHTHTHTHTHTAYAHHAHNTY